MIPSLDLSLAEASEAVRSRKVSSLELVDAALSQAEVVNGPLNAFLRIDFDAARDRARAADVELARGHYRGPLHGIPLAHKDIFYRAEAPCSFGSRVKIPIPDATSAALARLDDAGAVQIGALNMSPFAVGPTGHNMSFGPCRNPWNRDRISGGSSSGSAAAVAARACFGSLGSDTAGSIRLPAAMCGVTGLKPTYGRVSRAGAMALSFSLDTIGPLARSSRDCALILNAIAGSDDRDPTTARSAAPDFLDGICRPVAGLRVGIPKSYFDDDLAPELSQGLEAAREVLKDLGCRLVPIEIPDLSVSDAAADIVFSCESAALHQHLMREQSGGYEKQMRARLERGFAIPAPAYLTAVRYREVALAEFVRTVFADVDFIQTPVLSCLTPTIDEAATTSSDDVERIIGRLTRFTRPFNFLGLPALAVPIGFSSENMPMSQQFVGRPFSEARLLQLGHAFQQATSWHAAVPPL